MKMKRILSLAVAAVMTVGLLAGCGGGSSSSSSGTAAPAASGSAAPAEKVELNVIAAQYGTKTADWWANFVNEFNAANEGINLPVDVVSWNDICTVVNTRIANGEAPDILNIDVFADYQADDLLLPALLTLAVLFGGFYFVIKAGVKAALLEFVNDPKFPLRLPGSDCC